MTDPARSGQQGALLDGRPATAEQLAALALINYGHFTTMLVEGGRVRGLTEHCERLRGDCRRLFGVELDPARIREQLHRAIEGRPERFLTRITVFDPAADLLHPDGEPSLLITTRPAGAGPLPPLRLGTIAVSREPAEVKHVGLFGALWARRRAREAGHDDALLLDADDKIAEGPTWNVGFVDHDRVVWPEAAALPGITQRLLQRIAPDSITRPVRRTELGAMSAAFATSSGFGLRMIAAIDGHDYPTDHPLPGELARAYSDLPGEAP